MVKIEKIYCPNCGSHAEKCYSSKHHTIQVECPTCDYFLLSCAKTGNVREAYAPGIAVG